MLVKIILYVLPFLFCINLTNYAQVKNHVKPFKITERSLSDTTKGGIARLNINTVPTNAEIILNDSLYGRSPLHELDLPIGEYKLQIRHDDCASIWDTLLLKQIEYTVDAVMTSNYGYIVFQDKTLEVKIDGQYVDSENKIKVEPGKREFIVFDRMDQREVKEKYLVRANQELFVSLKKRQFTAKNLLVSAAVPGGGQILNGAWLEGLGFAVPLAVSLGFYFDAKSKYETEHEIYEKGLLDYYNSRNEFELLLLKENVIESQERLNNLVDKQKLYGWISIGIYVLNLADALIFHSFLDRLDFTPKPLTLQGYNLGFQLRIDYQL